jgi:uncharacterized protein (TIGR01777 family)
MRVVLTGATGTIGSSLTSALLADGHEVVVLSRDAERAAAALPEAVEAHAWRQPTKDLPPEAALTGADAVVNLMGEPVAQYWTLQSRPLIRDSRVVGTRLLVEALKAIDQESRPRTLISQSAVGYYGPRDEQPLGEDATPGADFLADIVVAWEREAHAADELMRVVVTRTGVVLSTAGGALARMLPFFRLGVGGPVAGGRQYVPWVHIDDVIGAIRFALVEPNVRGPVNVTAPAPVTNAEFSKVLARALHRPAVMRVPALALRALYGEMSHIITTGQRAIPERLEQLGYAFRYPDLSAALQDVLQRS